MVKKKSRASASRAKGAKKGASKGTKKRVASRKTMPTRRLSLAAQETSGALDVKKLKDDLGRAIVKLDDRINKGDPAKGLSETRSAFSRWIMEIDNTVCVGADGPCGDTMLIGS